MALMLIPTKVITDALKHSENYATKFKKCKGTPKIETKETTLFLRPNTKVYREVSRKGPACRALADTTLDKLAKARSTFNKAKGGGDWGPKKRAKYLAKIAATEKKVYKKLGITGATAKEAQVTSHQVSAVRTAAEVAVEQNVPMPPPVREEMKNRVKHRLRKKKRKGKAVPSDAQVDAMSDADILSYNDALESEEDELFDDEGPLAMVTENPLVAVGVLGGSALAVWWLFSRGK